MNNKNTVLSANAEKDWKNYDDFAKGIATNRLPNTHDLLGKTLELHFDNQMSMSLYFEKEHVIWTSSSIEQTLGIINKSGRDPYEEVCTSDQQYFIDISFIDQPKESLTITLNILTRRVLAVKSTILDEIKEGSRLAQVFLVGVLAGEEATGIIPAPTRELIGYRALNIYSPNHYYEHFYVNSERYAWQNLRGVQFGQGDMDYCSCYKFDDDQYVFTFREKIIPVCSVFFFDYRLGRCTGKFIGITGENEILISPAGAFIQKMSYNCYPNGVAPL